MSAAATAEEFGVADGVEVVSAGGELFFVVGDASADQRMPSRPGSPMTRTTTCLISRAPVCAAVGAATEPRGERRVYEGQRPPTLWPLSVGSTLHST